MTNSPNSPTPAPQDTVQTPEENSPEATDAFIKLAMRNMVSKGGKSLFHFGLTLVGMLGVLVGLAYLTH